MDVMGEDPSPEPARTMALKNPQKPRLVALGSLIFGLFLSGISFGKGEPKNNHEYPIVHRVQPGQTLGMIGKRWNVNVNVLCHANGISRKEPIKPGQVLIVPALPDKEGKQAERLRKRGFLEEKKREALLAELRPKPEPAPKKVEKPAPSKANTPSKGAAKSSAEKAGSSTQQSSKDDTKRPPAPQTPEKRASSTTKPAAKSARTSASKKPSGFVRISSLMGKWEGYVYDARGNINPAAIAGFRRVLRSWRDGSAADIHPDLIRMVAEVSVYFKNKPIVVVSGYRPKTNYQFTPHSKHNTGHAIDFRIEGVKNEELRDFARKFKSAGVGYYPNSNFIHLDSRPQQTYWVDYSAPGEKPRYAHRGAKPNASETETQNRVAQAEAPKAPAPSKAEANSNAPSEGDGSASKAAPAEQHESDSKQSPPADRKAKSEAGANEPTGESSSSEAG